MAFLDEFGKKFTKTSQSMAKKAKEVAEVSNLKLQIKDEERALRGNFAELGEKYYALHSEDAQAELAESVEKVMAGKRKISLLEERIAQIENERVCPNCSTKLPEKGMFCPACGTKYPEAEEEEEAAVDYHTCAKCGAQVMENESFCTKCGAKQEETIQVPTEDEIADVVEEESAKEEEGSEAKEETAEKCCEADAEEGKEEAK